MGTSVILSRISGGAVYCIARMWIDEQYILEADYLVIAVNAQYETIEHGIGYTAIYGPRARVMAPRT